MFPKQIFRSQQIWCKIIHFCWKYWRFELKFTCFVLIYIVSLNLHRKGHKKSSKLPNFFHNNFFKNKTKIASTSKIEIIESTSTQSTPNPTTALNRCVCLRSIWYLYKIQVPNDMKLARIGCYIHQENLKVHMICLLLTYGAFQFHLVSETHADNELDGKAQRLIKLWGIVSLVFVEMAHRLVDILRTIWALQRERQNHVKHFWMHLPSQIKICREYSLHGLDMAIKIDFIK